MREANLGNVAGDTLKKIGAFLLDGEESSRIEGMPLNGKRSVLWEMVGKLETEVCCSLATADGSDPLPLASQTDVAYFEGSLPVVITVPYGGLEGSSGGSSAALLEWAGQTTAASATVESDCGTVALVEAIRERCRLTVGALPHIIVVNLHPSIVCVTKSRREATERVFSADANPNPSEADTVKSSEQRNRAEAAWKNYHTLIEVARRRIAVGGGGAARSGAGMLIEVTSSTTKGWMGGVAHISYAMSSFGLQRVRGDTDGAANPTNAGKEDEAIAEAFAMFDVDGSGEIDRKELAAVAKELGVPMSEKDLDDAMLQMDEDGSGEVDLEEFAGWYKSLTASSAGGRPSKLELIKLNAILASSSIPALGRRQNWSPTQAIFGAGALGSLLCSYGVPAFPSDTHSDQSKLEEKLGLPSRPGGGKLYDGENSWTLSSHGSGDGGLPVDAMGLLAPAEWFGADAASAPPSSARRKALACEQPALAAWGARVADGLVACLVTTTTTNARRARACSGSWANYM